MSPLQLSIQFKGAILKAGKYAQRHSLVFKREHLNHLLIVRERGEAYWVVIEVKVGA